MITLPTFALDYTGARYDFDRMKAAGVSGVIRYTKYISASEARAIRAADLDLALVEETTANMMLSGATGGAIRAAHANDVADSIGFPLDRPIYYACDTDITTALEVATVRAFLNGVAGHSGRQAGLYGEADLIDACYASGHATYCWQSYAWSHHRLSPHATLFQRLDNPLGPVGVGTDVNDLHALDWGAWGNRTTGPDPQPLGDDEMMTMAHTSDAPPAGALPQAYYSCVGLERSHLSPGMYYALSTLKVPDFGENDVWVAKSPQEVAPSTMPDGT